MSNGAMSRSSQICTLNLTSRATSVPVEPAPFNCPTRKRLAKAFDCLEKLEWQRVQRGDPALGKFVEERIIWLELLELELQAIDEQLERMSAVVRMEAD